MSLCNCEIPASLSAIVGNKQRIGQITRLYFQRTRTAGVDNKFTVATEDPTLLATWVAAAALTTSAKVIQSPILDEFTPTGGGVIEYTGNTANGIPKPLGEEPHTWTFELLDGDQVTTAAALKALQCEPTATDGLSLFAVNDCGNVIGKSTDDYVTFMPIPIEALSVLGVDKFGRTTPGSNMIKITLKPDWADYLKIIAPADFNAQTVIF